MVFLLGQPAYSAVHETNEYTGPALIQRMPWGADLNAGGRTGREAEGGRERTKESARAEGDAKREDRAHAEEGGRTEESAHADEGARADRRGHSRGRTGGRAYEGGRSRTSADGGVHGGGFRVH